MRAKPSVVRARSLLPHQRSAVKDLAVRIRSLSTEVGPGESLGKNISRVVEEIESSGLPQETQRKLMSALSLRRERLIAKNKLLAKQASQIKP